MPKWNLKKRAGQQWYPNQLYGSSLNIIDHTSLAGSE